MFSTVFENHFKKSHFTNLNITSTSTLVRIPKVHVRLVRNQTVHIRLVRIQTVHIRLVRIQTVHILLVRIQKVIFFFQTLCDFQG